MPRLFWVHGPVFGTGGARDEAEGRLVRGDGLGEGGVVAELGALVVEDVGLGEAVAPARLGVEGGEVGGFGEEGGGVAVAEAGSGNTGAFGKDARLVALCLIEHRLLIDPPRGHVVAQRLQSGIGVVEPAFTDQRGGFLPHCLERGRQVARPFGLDEELAVALARTAELIGIGIRVANPLADVLEQGDDRSVEHVAIGSKRIHLSLQRAPFGIVGRHVDDQLLQVVELLSVFFLTLQRDRPEVRQHFAKDVCVPG